MSSACDVTLDNFLCFSTAFSSVSFPTHLKNSANVGKAMQASG
jgi:hypothetical protein